MLKKKEESRRAAAESDYLNFFGLNSATKIAWSNTVCTSSCPP